MSGLGQSILEEGLEQGVEQGIQAFVLDSIEEQQPKERVLGKLERHFNLTQITAEKYYDKFAKGNC